MHYRARYLSGDKEEWRSIPSAPQYSASSLGRIRRDENLDRLGRRVSTAGRALTPRLMNRRSGHLGVTLSCDGVAAHRLVHRLVAETFHGPQPDGFPFVCHINGDPSDNRAENLAWGNGTTNAADRTRHGRTLRGEGVGNSKLTPALVIQIRNECATGKTQKEISRTFGVSQSLVSMIRTRKVWGHI